MSLDSTKVSPDVFKVLFENDKVRVLEERMKRRQKTAMHTHPAHVYYALNSGRLKVTLPDGKSHVVKIKKGEVSWSDGDSHATENLRNTVSKGLSVELKK